MVTLQREVDDEDGGGSGGKVVCPRYPAEKAEAWWLVVGDANSNALLSIKRVSIGGASTKVRASTVCGGFIEANLFYSRRNMSPLLLLSLLTADEAGVHRSGGPRGLQLRALPDERQLLGMRPRIRVECYCSG